MTPEEADIRAHKIADEFETVPEQATAFAAARYAFGQFNDGLYEWQAKIDVLQRDAIKHEREIEAMKDWTKRVADENNAKLMAIFYSLDTLRTCGTHHEKRVVLTHLMASIDRMLNKESYGLSYKNDDLPF